MDARGFWFNSNGNLVKFYIEGLKARRSDFEDYQGVHVARRIDMFRDSAPTMQIRVTEVNSPDDSLPTNFFEFKGHEVSRQFTSEAR